MITFRFWGLWLHGVPEYQHLRATAEHLALPSWGPRRRSLPPTWLPRSLCKPTRQMHVSLPSPPGFFRSSVSQGRCLPWFLPGALIHMQKQSLNKVLELFQSLLGKLGYNWCQTGLCASWRRSRDGTMSEVLWAHPFSGCFAKQDRPLRRTFH